MGGLLVAFLILVILILAVVVSCIKIVPQAHAYIVERLGGYLATWPVGLHLLIPFIDRVAKKVTLKEQVVDFPPQPVILRCRLIRSFISRSQIRSCMHTVWRIR